MATTKVNGKAINMLSAMLTCVMFLSCDDSAKVWEQTQSVDNCKWNMEEILQYTMPVDDTVSWFNLLLDLRNRTDYSYSNIYLFVKTEAPNGAFSVDTLEYSLAYDTGEWTGRGGSSGFKENRFPFRTTVRFPVKGDYSINIRHGMRDTVLTGIATVGVRLEHVK
jgi:gliding motility-associated lipoprotein GldH